MNTIVINLINVRILNACNDEYNNFKIFNLQNTVGRATLICWVPRSVARHRRLLSFLVPQVHTRLYLVYNSYNSSSADGFPVPKGESRDPGPPGTPGPHKVVSTLYITQIILLQLVGSLVLRETQETLDLLVPRVHQA